MTVPAGIPNLASSPAIERIALDALAEAVRLPAGLGQRPVPYWVPERHSCGSSTRGFDVPCTACTRRTGTATLLEGACVCPVCN
jgi:hypothetical protein